MFMPYAMKPSDNEEEGLEEAEMDGQLLTEMSCPLA